MASSNALERALRIYVRADPLAVDDFAILGEQRDAPDAAAPERSSTRERAKALSG